MFDRLKKKATDFIYSEVRNGNHDVSDEEVYEYLNDNFGHEVDERLVDINDMYKYQDMSAAGAGYIEAVIDSLDDDIVHDAIEHYHL